MVEFPARGQQAPQYWDTQLKQYIDERVTPETVEENLPERLSEGGLSATIAAQLGDVADPESVAALLADAAVAAAMYGYQDHGNVSGAVAIDPTIGTHVLDATGPLTLELDDAPDGQIITILVVSGADDVTLVDIDGDLTDGAFATFVRIRGGWMLAASGGASGTPDTTPPSPVTGLSATGGEGTLTLAWSAATDDESTVRYRYRVWLTSGGATGAWVTTTTTSATVTGLAAGGYTAEVYAYSTGGASATATATATVVVPPGWSTIAEDTFTAADNTPIAGRVAGGGTWSNADAKAVIIDNHVVVREAGEPASQANLTLTCPAAVGADGIEVWVSYNLLSQPDTGLAHLGIYADGWPAFGATYDSTPVRVGVSGYNAENTYTTLLSPTEVSPGRLGRFGIRKTGNLFEVLKADGTVAGTFDSTGGYSGYVDQPIGAEVHITFNGFKSSYIDDVTVRVLT